MCLSPQKIDKKWQKMAKNGKKWQTLQKWQKCQKVAKGGKKWQKGAKIGKKWQKWQKVVKSGRIHKAIIYDGFLFKYNSKKQIWSTNIVFIVCYLQQVTVSIRVCQNLTFSNLCLSWKVLPNMGGCSQRMPLSCIEILSLKIENFWCHVFYE